MYEVMRYVFQNSDQELILFRVIEGPYGRRQELYFGPLIGKEAEVHWLPIENFAPHPEGILLAKTIAGTLTVVPEGVRSWIKKSQWDNEVLTVHKDYAIRPGVEQDTFVVTLPHQAPATPVKRRRFFRRKQK